MLKNTPPMGWNSWNTFAADISERLIFDTSDALVESGLSKAGYEYIVIDDCWALKERSSEGKLVADPEKFPNGMKAVADYIHSKGLKFGMYSCAGNLTCAGYPGSYEHEFEDAKTFAEWGVDYLKYDYCYHNNIIHGKYLYRRMGLALKNCGRDILFSACSWGADNTAEWIRETSADMWRSTADIVDNWNSIKSLVNEQESIFPYGGINCFNDMDMLVVGMYGKGHVGLGGMNDTEYKTHFTLWALFGSSLMIGCDIRNLGEEAYDILTNSELIRINQDRDCRQVFKISNVWGASGYARYLENGDIAVGLFNFGDESVFAKMSADELGIPESTGKTIVMHELWTGNAEQLKNGSFMHKIEPHSCLVYRCEVTDL